MRRGIVYESEVDVEVTYGGVVVGRHRLDVTADGGIVIELKAVQSLEAVHFAQLRSYLKATRRPIGLLLNFGEPRLVIKRVILSHPAEAATSDPPFSPTLPRLPD
jgi:GxxExxY protein